MYVKRRAEVSQTADPKSAVIVYNEVCGLIVLKSSIAMEGKFLVSSNTSDS